MARLLLLLALAAVVFWVFTVVDCAAQPAVRHRGVGKSVWVVIVLVLPVLGGVLWFAIGRAPARSLAVQAPDDDPEFLRGLGASSAPRPSAADDRARAEQDERIRRLEEELARLDDDGDNPRPGTHPDRRPGPHRDR